MTRLGLFGVSGWAAGPLLLLLCVAPARAQRAGHGGGMGMGGGARMGGFGGGGGGFGRPNDSPPPRNGPDSAGTMSSMRGGLQLGPPGRWWDDKHFAKDLKLRPDQQQRMDAIFEANRSTLLTRLSTVQQEQVRLEQLTRAKSPDEGTLNAQIDKVWQSLAELEKAKTHYLLQIRQEMDADQLSRLEDHR